MNVYLVQHGEAEPENIDPTRPLTERGRQEVEGVATFAARLDLDLVQIQHSGKTRAEQTATILGTLTPQEERVIRLRFGLCMPEWEQALKRCLEEIRESRHS